MIALEGLTNASALPLLSALSTGVKHGTRLSATAISMVLWAAKIEPLSESPLHPLRFRGSAAVLALARWPRPMPRRRVRAWRRSQKVAGE